MTDQDVLFQKFGRDFPKGTILFHEGDGGSDDKEKRKGDQQLLNEMENGEPRNQCHPKKSHGQTNKDEKGMRGRAHPNQDKAEENDNLCTGIQMVDEAVKAAVMIYEFMPHQERPKPSSLERFCPRIFF